MENALHVIALTSALRTYVLKRSWPGGIVIKNPTRPPPPGLKMYLLDIAEDEDEDMEEGGGEPPDSDDESLNAFEMTLGPCP